MRAAVRGERTLRFGKLRIEIYPSGYTAGRAAAKAVAEALKRIGALRENFGVIFATGTSQLDPLRALRKIDKLPWRQVYGFNMDDYVGLPAEHPASFRAYLRRELPQRALMKGFLEIDGSAPNVDRMCRKYAEDLRRNDPQLCLLGIGENGHLAFNHPDEANFSDLLDLRVVRLDTMCRDQQVAEGWFLSHEDVPQLAVTLTIPALLRVPRLILSIPGRRKARIGRRTVSERISRECPSTILRTHPDATLYLDEESAAELHDLEGDVGD